MTTPLTTSDNDDEDENDPSTTPNTRPRRRRRKFSLLLSPVSLPPSSSDSHLDENHSKRCWKKSVMFLNTIKSAAVVGMMAVVSLVALPLWLSFYDHGGERSGGIGTIAKSDLARKFDSKEGEDVSDDGVESDSQDDRAGADKTSMSEVQGSGRPFDYIGDIDPTKPLPWPKKEEDWWALHERLARRVAESDSLSPVSQHDNNDDNDDDDHSYLPQLIFYGDSITEGWNGTSFGNIPGEHRLWSLDEPSLIRRVFDAHFGQSSVWGRRAARPPLILGISGSKTYDFLWRVEHGEFPMSKVFDGGGRDDDGGSVTDAAANKYLERIFIILIGTNNLGGGMLPEPTVRGMDAVGRTVLQKLRERNAPQPSAILFSELLPRRDDHRAKKMCPPRCRDETTLEPFSSFMPAIEKVNRALPNVLQGWKKDYPETKIVLLSSRKSDERVDGNDEFGDDRDIVYCGREMFAMESSEEFDSHMPDGLHPNSKGYDLWARCIERGLEAVMDGKVQLS